MKSIAQNIFLVTLTVMILQFLKVDAIDCFQCNSLDNSGCTTLENYNKRLFYPLPCEDYDGRQAFCRKTVIQVMDKVKQNEKRVIRSCGYIPHKSECYRADNEGHTEQVCQCFENGCNTSSTVLVSTFLTISSFIVSKILLI